MTTKQTGYSEEDIKNAKEAYARLKVLTNEVGDALLLVNTGGVTIAQANEKSRELKKTTAVVDKYLKYCKSQGIKPE
jgi:hypothetical protein